MCVEGLQRGAAGDVQTYRHQRHAVDDESVRDGPDPAEGLGLQLKDAGRLRFPARFQPTRGTGWSLGGFPLAT